MRLQPFAALRPTPDHAPAVASVPYDVVNRAEAAELAGDNPLSFLRVVRAEIDLPAEVDPYDDQVYAKARDNLAQLQRDGVLVRDETPSLYLYRLVMGEHSQVGIVGCVHIDDYEQNLIKRHEKTRRDKEDDRTRHILELDADAEPVILTYRGMPDIDRLVETSVAADPVTDFTAEDGVRHTVWRCADSAALAEAFAAVPCAYVADGHHRCASAWRAGTEKRANNPNHRGDEEYHWFPAVLFPSEQLRIMAYNRVVKLTEDLTAEQVTERLSAAGTLAPATSPEPAQPGATAVYMDGSWRLLSFDPASVDCTDPVRSLDVDLLQTRVLEPIFGIADVRSDPRIGFVGGIRGTTELERRVDSGEMTAAFSMYPTDIDQLLAVADADLVMPPKSTWFEPKLRSGLFVHTLD